MSFSAFSVEPKKTVFLLNVCAKYTVPLLLRTCWSPKKKWELPGTKAFIVEVSLNKQLKRCVLRDFYQKYRGRVPCLCLQKSKGTPTPPPTSSPYTKPPQGCEIRCLNFIEHPKQNNRQQSVIGKSLLILETQTYRKTAYFQCYNIQVTTQTTDNTYCFLYSRR